MAIAFTWAVTAYAEDDGISLDQPLFGPAVTSPTVAPRTAWQLTPQLRAAFTGTAPLMPRFKSDAKRTWGNFDFYTDQYLSYTVHFEKEDAEDPEDPEIAPVDLQMSITSGTIYINRHPFGGDRRPGDERPADFKKYYMDLGGGRRLIVIRPSLNSLLISAGGLICVNVDYRYIPGVRSVPPEWEQSALVPKSVSFVASSSSHARFDSSIKTAFIKTYLETSPGIQPPKVTHDQTVGHDPSVRLVYIPESEEPLLVPFNSQGVVDEWLKASAFVHMWDGTERTVSVYDHALLKRVTLDRELERFIRDANGGKIKGPIECVSLQWDQERQVKVGEAPEGELQDLVEGAAQQGAFPALMFRKADTDG
jgi:hypothetical protein